MTKPLILAASSNKNKPIPIPIPQATPCGKLRSIQARIPVIEIIVKKIPNQNTAPKAIGILKCCVKTIPNVVKAVSDTAQPIAIGKLAHNPISKEPKAATRQVVINVASGGKPASFSILGITTTEYSMAKKMVK